MSGNTRLNRADSKIKCPKIVIYKATYRKNEAFRWTAYARNGNIIADGGEAYSSKAKAKQGIKALKSSLPIDESLAK